MILTLIERNLQTFNFTLQKLEDFKIGEGNNNKLITTCVFEKRENKQN